MERKDVVKLHLGCGGKKLEGWVNIDSVEAFGPDLVHDITQPLPYDEQSVDEILAEDLLEHFDKYMRFVVFYEWTRVLKIGGTITIVVPNFKKILFKYFKFGFNNFIDFIFGETMFFSEVYIGHFGNHKWGYSTNTLEDFVRLFGFEPEDVQCKGLNIRMCAKKVRHVSQEEIDKIEIYSHNNSHGEGRASLPVSFVREKIGIFEKDLSV